MKLQLCHSSLMLQGQSMPRRVCCWNLILADPLVAKRRNARCQKLWPNDFWLDKVGSEQQVRSHRLLPLQLALHRTPPISAERMVNREREMTALRQVQARN